MEAKDIMSRLPDEAKRVIEMCQGNYKQAFYALCKNKGIDPQSIISMLNGKI